MDRMWAPWRSKFIYNRKLKSCIFCKNPKEKRDKVNYIIKRTKFSFAMLNIYPYNNGHIMIAPLSHKKSLCELSDREILDLMKLTNEMTARLDRVLKPEGYNIGLNIGRISGAGYAGHLHIHIVPRWGGDTNFMPVLADTKIVAESLDSVYKRLT